MTILTAIDKDPGCEGVVSTAQELATGLGRELIVLHVVPESENVANAREGVERIVSDAVGDTDGVTLQVVSERARRDAPTGRTAGHVLDVAEDLDPDYIVIGSRKRTPLGKVLLGSVSQLVLTNADVPVVTVEQTT
ncbi:universal stress protein [Halobacteriales archaeon QS_8_65_32]|jgi:nucleotide-binding universal stress UspA family protein|nr:MAG: universal stress protein [Halobacteriales archaeon QS_8_65_32]